MQAEFESTRRILRSADKQMVLAPFMISTTLILLVVAWLLTPARTVVAADGQQPNILYVYVDDMGWGSIGPNGQSDRKAKHQPYVRTPNIDRLAREGINFTRGYGCHVCSPARSSQQSGFHQGHTFADRNDPDNAKKAMRSDDILIGDALSSVGYATGYWGKWGYGGSKSQVDPVIQNVQTLPTSHGYRHVLAELHHVRAHTFFQPTLWQAPASSGAIGGLELASNSMSRYQNDSRFPDAPAFQNHADYPSTAYCDDSYAFAALEFVRQQGQAYNESGKPFFGLLAVQIPHAPFGEIAALPDWDKAYADDRKFASLAGQTRQWAAMVTRMDAHVGNLLAALDDPNHDGDTSDSVADETLVIFQSDNGGPRGENNRELDANGGLRGNKGSIQEGGIRVPLVMRWPAKIHADSKLRAGTNNDMVVDVTDLLPTFCQLAGASRPLGIDGVSIAPTLLGQGHQRSRDFIIHEASNGQSIIRGNHKLVRSKDLTLQLFDLEADRTEANDLADQHPDLVSELESLLLGERVAEPRGFSNTYHHWTGGSGASTTDPDNWSDYRYANAGVTYMTDTGKPRLSWIARIMNADAQPNVARADGDIEVLGLEVVGSGETSTQSLALGPNINLVGRNEVRVSKYGTITVDGGKISTNRWIDVRPHATLKGNGQIDGIIYNQGSIIVGNGNQRGLDLSADYHQSAGAALAITVDGDDNALLRVAGAASLAGSLHVATGKGFQPVSGQSFTVLSAANLSGRFDNPGDQIVCGDGTRLTIGYSDSKVTLTAN